MAHPIAAKRTEAQPAKSKNAANGSVTIKIQLRTHDLFQRIIDKEAEEMMAATGGGSCEGCIDEFRRRIPMTEIIHRAARMMAKAKGLKP